MLISTSALTAAGGAVQFQDSAPKPTNKDIFIADSGKDKVFVSQFGGFLVDEFTLAAKVKALRRDLDVDNESYEDDGEYLGLSGPG